MITFDYRREFFKRIRPPGFESVFFVFVRHFFYRFLRFLFPFFLYFMLSVVRARLFLPLLHGQTHSILEK